MSPLIRFQDVYRDAIQSLFGTNPSADEIITAYPTAHLIGTDMIQTGGGTFFDIFAKKGRNEWEEVKKIITHFKNLGVRQSALIRGDFLFSYEPQSYDVVRATIFEYAEMGMNVLQNFHGMNDARCLVGVAKAVKEAQEAGHDISWQGVICIEDNPNITVDGCIKYAQELVDMGCEDIYLKSASGRLDPEFVRELTARLLDRFPDQDITIHAHSTYGEAPVCYVAAAEEAVKRGQKITMDVQHPAMAGSTAHPSMSKMTGLFKNHPWKIIRDNMPKLNIDAIKQSMKSLYELRFDYGAFESKYKHELLEAMRPARVPGGASATLKAIPGLEANLARLLGTDDWDKIQIAIYDMQAKILEDLGQPTQVTPYAANTTGQAALSLASELQGKGRYDVLYPGMVNYLVGRHGRVPDTVNPELIEKALEEANLKEPVEYVLSTDKPDALPELKNKLIEAGIENPTDKQAISLAMTGNIKHIVACANNNNVPQSPPELPDYAQVAEPGGKIRGKARVKSFSSEDIVAAIGGRSELKKLAARAVHLKQLDDHLYPFPNGEKSMEQKWYEGNVKAIAKFLDDVPVHLKKAGFKSFKNFEGLEALSPKADFHLHRFQAILREVCDAGGEGLYDHMMAGVSEYRQNNAIKFKQKTPANDHSGALQVGVGELAASPK